jgi:hypothetical protein
MGGWNYRSHQVSFSRKLTDYNQQSQSNKTFKPSYPTKPEIKMKDKIRILSIVSYLLIILVGQMIGLPFIC